MMDRMAVQLRRGTLTTDLQAQRDRLAVAEGETQAARASIERHLGALADCDFWLEQLKDDAPVADTLYQDALQSTRVESPVTVPEPNSQTAGDAQELDRL